MLQAKGFSPQEIANALYISERTVFRYLERPIKNVGLHPDCLSCNSYLARLCVARRIRR